MSPAISALLTTHNRAHLLPRVLEGLQKQTLPQSQFEIIAIDDGSVDDTQGLLACYTAILPLRIFHQGASGLATAKNLGIYTARAPIIVFLDDDDVLDPNALSAYHAIHLANPDPSVAVLGHTTLDVDVAKSPVMRHVTETGCQLFSYKWIEPGKHYGYQEFWGGRSSCKRDFLLKHGVFNPVFRFGYEDVELGWRLRPHGLRVIYEPAASATMIRDISFEEFCQRSILQGRSLFTFNQMYTTPEIQAYCDIENCLAMWGAHWRNYAAILRYAAQLDEKAADQILGGDPLQSEFQAELDAYYARAFALSRAKGVADAAWLVDQVTSSQRHSGYGLPGDFATVKQRIGVSKPHAPSNAANAATRLRSAYTFPSSCPAREGTKESWPVHDLTINFDYAHLIAEEKAHFSDIVVTEQLKEGGVHANKAWEYYWQGVGEVIGQSGVADLAEYLCGIAPVTDRPLEILSLASGYCGNEIDLARRMTRPYKLVCTELNEAIFDKAKAIAENENLAISFELTDLNFITIESKRYDMIFAHAALHHVINLEHLFEQIAGGLSQSGIFFVGEVVGKNRKLIWDHNEQYANALLDLLPDRITRGVRMAISEEIGGMEGIRQEDILPLIRKHFSAVFEFRHGAFMRFICTHSELGPAFDPENSETRRYLDFLIDSDRCCVRHGILQPLEIWGIYRVSA